MKALMNLAKQKRVQETSNQSSSITQKSQLNKFAQPQSEMSDGQDFDEDYEPQVEEIIAYAQFIGIKLPQQQELLWIAREGLQTELPADWQEAETQQGEIAYTNVRTGQIMFQHPCDEYYRQLVLKERKKSTPVQSKISQQKSNLSGGIQPVGVKSLLKNKQPSQVIVDPLVKMQRQKQQKKLQQQKRKQYSQKKQELVKKYDSKRQVVQKQYKKKQQKTRQRFNEQLQKQRKVNIQKMSLEQKQQQQKKQLQLRQYQKQTKQRQQRQLQQKDKKQRVKMQRKYQQKRQQIRQQLQKKLSKQKKQIDKYYNEKYMILQVRQQKIQQQQIQLSTNKLLQQEISTMKSQIIRKKLSTYTQKLKQQTQGLKHIYTQQVQALQQQHNNKVKQLQSTSTTNQITNSNNIKLQQLLKDIQQYQHQELKIFQYQLQLMKDIKQLQIQQKLANYKHKLQQLHKDKLNNISILIDKEFNSFKQLKQQDYQNIILQTQNKAKTDFINTLKILQKNYQQQQQITLISNNNNNKYSNNRNILDKQNLQSLNRLYQQLQYQQKQLRKQRQSIKLQIQNLRSQSNIVNPIMSMNQNQIKLYQLIQDKIKTNTNTNNNSNINKHKHSNKQ